MVMVDHAAAARALRLAYPRPHPRRPRRAPYGGTGGRPRGSQGAVMILVCGGLADGVTELVCSRLQDCGYPYRLLDLARFPEDYRVSWRWTDSGPEGWIAATDWRLDLDAISGVYARFLGPEDRPPLPGLDPADAAALRAEGDLGLMALLEDLAMPGGQPHRRRALQQFQAVPGARHQPRRPQRATDARHQRPRRGPRLSRRARRGDLQVGQRHPLDRPPPRPGPSRAPRSPVRRPGAVPGVRSRPQCPRAHCRRPGLRHPDRVRGGGLPLRPCRRPYRQARGRSPCRGQWKRRACGSRRRSTSSSPGST